MTTLFVRSQRLQAILSFVALLIAINLHSAFLDFLRRLDVAWVEAPADKLLRWDPRVFEALTFGHIATATDTLWIRTLQDDALTKMKPGEHPLAYYDLDLVTDLDRAFAEAYVHGATLIAVIRGDGIGARDLLLKAQRFRKEELPTYPEEFRKKFWALEWAVPLRLAYVYLFELDDMISASLVFREAAVLPNAPEYLKNLANRFEAPDGSYEVGMKLIRFMLSSTRDPILQAELTRKRNSLFLSSYLRQLNRDFHQYVSGIKAFKSTVHVSEKDLTRAWMAYRKEKRIHSKDPFGGELFLRDSGEIDSTTPRVPVFGLN